MSGQLVGLRVVVSHFASIRIKAIADGLPGHVIARSTAIVKGPFAHANQIDANRIAVQFCDFAAGGRAAALIRLLARRTRANDEQVKYPNLE